MNQNMMRTIQSTNYVNKSGQNIFFQYISKPSHVATHSIYNTSYAVIYYRHIIDSAKGFLHQALTKTIGMFVVLSFDKVFNSDVSIASWKVINECVK